MQQRQFRSSDHDRAEKLTAELEMWRLQGYRVTSREPTVAHLLKPKGSPFGWVVLALLLSLLLIPFTSVLVAGAVFLVLLVLTVAYQAGRHDTFVQLTVDPDGTVYRE